MLEHQFQEQSISPKHFQIENVVGDNSCLYRSIANGLHYRTSAGEEILDINASRIHNKDYQEVYDKEGWGLSGKIQELYSRKLQQISHNWMKKNRYQKYPEIGITYRDLVESVHEIPFEEYETRYSHFAGDEVYEIKDTGKIYQRGKRKGSKILHKIYMEERWGGLPEQLALSNYFQIPIIIYTSQKFDNHRKKVITGRIRNNKAEKGVRFKLYQIIGEKYLSQDITPILLLWKKSVNGPHYMALYQKESSTRFNSRGIPFKKDK
jgi:hypothetical protein